MLGECRVCGDEVSEGRMALGYKLCLFCGEEQAREDRRLWTVAPMNKSNYTLITDRNILKQLNPKRTT